MAAELVPAGIEAHFDREVIQPCLEGERVHVAGAFVQKAGHHVAQADAVFRIVGRPTVKREAHGDDRKRRLVDQPGLDAAGADDALHLGGCRGRDGDECRDEGRHRQDAAQDQAADDVHVRPSFSGCRHQTAGFGSRTPVTEWFMSRTFAAAAET